MSERPDPFEILQEIHPVADRRRLEYRRASPRRGAAGADHQARRDASRVACSAGAAGRWAVAAGVVVAFARRDVGRRRAVVAEPFERPSGARVLRGRMRPTPTGTRCRSMPATTRSRRARCCGRTARSRPSGQPPSQICSTGTGTTAVVPGDDPSACARAGLEPFDPSRGDGATLDDQRTVDRLSSRLVAVVPRRVPRRAGIEGRRRGGVGRRRARRLERRRGGAVLDRSADAASADVDAAERTIVIAAIPPAPTGGG